MILQIIGISVLVILGILCLIGSGYWFGTESEINGGLVILLVGLFFMGFSIFLVITVQRDYYKEAIPDLKKIMIEHNYQKDLEQLEENQ